MSFGFITEVTRVSDTMYINGNAVTGGTYRGTGQTECIDLIIWELYGKWIVFFQGEVHVNRYPDDTLVGQLADAGIHICIAAGNNGYKIDVFGGTDYDNNLTIVLFNK